jgi:pimeloyl-ACP methyl ester carboxylesterase
MVKSLPEAVQHGDYVVLLHGIAYTNAQMRPLARYLDAHGFETLNITYPSTKYDLQTLADWLHERLDATLKERKPVHFVTHSMGGLLARAYLHKHRPENLGYVVQIAPPNRGSEVADYWKNTWIYKKIYGPAGQQLITEQDSINSIFGVVDYPLGVIAGNCSIDPISSWILPGEDDGKVSVERTKLDGMADHITLPVTHTFAPCNKEVKHQVLSFLTERTFDRA